MAHEVIPIVIVAVLLTLMLTVWRFGRLVLMDAIRHPFTTSRIRTVDGRITIEPVNEKPKEVPPISTR
jgi:hypothetical protein